MGMAGRYLVLRSWWCGVSGSWWVLVWLGRSAAVLLYWGRRLSRLGLGRG